MKVYGKQSNYNESYKVEHGPVHQASGYLVDWSRLTHNIYRRINTMVRPPGMIM